MTRFPTVRRVRIGTFNVGINQPEAVRLKLEAIMQREFNNFDWRCPRDEVVVEDLSTIANIMQEFPKGTQACIGKVPVKRTLDK